MGVLRIRKKPVEVSAMLYDGTFGCARAIEEWSLYKAEALIVDHATTLRMKTLESKDDEWLTASPGDYIIRGVKGEFYPCKPDVFAATYEVVKDPPSGPWCLQCDRPPSEGCYDGDRMGAGRGNHDIMGSVPYG